MSATPDFSILSGDWLYRSFINTTQPAQQLSDILFGEGDITLSLDPQGFYQNSTLSFGPGYLMNLRGQAVAQNEGTFSQPRFAIEMKAFGVEGQETAGWLYEHRGYLVPNWYNGVNQVTAIVGTVIRVVPHGAGSPAGVVASFVALKK